MEDILVMHQFLNNKKINYLKNPARILAGFFYFF